MQPQYSALIAAALIIISLYTIKAINKKKAAEAIKEKDEKILHVLHENFAHVKLSELMGFSDKPHLAYLIAKKITLYLSLGIHPNAFVTILGNLELLRPYNDKLSSEQVQFIAVIKNEILGELTSLEIENWTKLISVDSTKAFAELNNSFLRSIRKNKMVWAPQYN